jgi:hypothetical protein
MGGVFNVGSPVVEHATKESETGPHRRACFVLSALTACEANWLESKVRPPRLRIARVQRADQGPS